MEGQQESLPDLPVTTEYLYQEKVPAFFGHYWLRGEPALSSDYAACLDFSVAKEGALMPIDGLAKMSCRRATSFMKVQPLFNVVTIDPVAFWFVTGVAKTEYYDGR